MKLRKQAHLVSLFILSLGSASCGSSDPEYGTYAPGSFTDSSTAIDLSNSGDGVLSDSLSPPNDSSTGPTTPAAEIDPNCLDGKYTENLSNPNADISAELASYSSSNYLDFIKAVLAKRYPVGGYLLEKGLLSDAFGGKNCVDAFLGEKGSGSQVLGQMSTLVHECGHFADIDSGGFSGAAYLITDTLNFTCQDGANTESYGKTFSRSIINEDAYSAQHPPCPEGSFSGDCDSYANIYLDGDPHDGNNYQNGTWQGGDQGFDMLFEETVQYVNSLATGYAFQDQIQWAVSERDGILTFLWYVERYLKMAREQYPAAYAHISQTACWREGILQVWGRAWLYLKATEGNGKLGLSDAKIIGLVRTPELLDEIQRLREVQGCQ